MWGNSPTGNSPDNTPGNPSNSSPADSPDSTQPPQNYKALMGSTYQQAIATMETVKTNTLALQKRSLSLGGYKSSILAAKATFTSDLNFARSHPPADSKLNAPYQEFIAGITLASQSMDVVLSGITALNPSSLYAAREMGKTAYSQVTDAYNHF